MLADLLAGIGRLLAAVLPFAFRQLRKQDDVKVIGADSELLKDMDESMEEDLQKIISKSEVKCHKCGTRMGRFNLMGKRYYKCPVCDTRRDI